MSVCALRWFKRLRLDQPDFFEAMTLSAKSVLRNLCERQSDFGEGTCRASHHEIAIAEGLSDDHVARMVKWLIQKTAIRRVEDDRDEEGKLRKISWMWGFRYEFGLGFVFQSAQNHPRRSPTIDRLIPDNLSPDPRQFIDSAQPPPYKDQRHKDQRRVNQNLFPLAQQLLETVGLPPTDLRQPVVDALVCEARKGKAEAEAYQFVLERTLQAQRRGTEINRWFFTEGKYLLAGLASSQGRRQQDLDERDLRILTKAEQELAGSMVGVWIVEQHPPPEGALSTRMVFERACSRTGIPFARGCHLKGFLDWIDDAPQAKRPPGSAGRAVNE